MSNWNVGKGSGPGGGLAPGLVGNYQAQGGETPEQLAERYKVGLNDLLQSNQFLQAGTPAVPGQQIQIPFAPPAEPSVASLPANRFDGGLVDRFQNLLSFYDRAEPALDLFQPQANVEIPEDKGPIPTWVPNPNISTSPGTFLANNKEAQRNRWAKGKTHQDGKTDKWDKNKAKKQSIGPGTYGVGNTLIGAEAYLAEIGKVDKNWDVGWGDLSLQGETRFLEARGRVYDYGGFNPAKGEIGLGIGAQGQLNLARAIYGVEHTGTLGEINGVPIDLTTNVTTEGFVGAQADAEAAIILGKEPRIRLGAGAFAGASASVTGSAELGGVGVTGSATGWAGIGAKADLTLGYEKGKLKFGFDVGAALGIGGQLSWGVSLDLNKIAKELQAIGDLGLDFANDALGAITGFSQDVANAITDTASDVANLLSNAATRAGDVAVNIGESIAGAVVDVGEGIGDAAQAVGDGISNAANAVGDGISNAANAVGDGISNAADAVGDAVGDAADAVGDAAKSVGKGIKKIFSGW